MSAMVRTNIDATRKAVEQHEATDMVQLDGDQHEALLRAMVDYDDLDAFEEWVEESLDVDVDKKKSLGEDWGMEVTLA